MNTSICIYIFIYILFIYILYLFIFISGYVVQALPYFRTPGQPFRIYEDVVLRLLRSANILGKLYHLYTDNYYTSVPMLEDLANNYNTFCCGTVRKNRKHLPKKLMKKKS